MKKNHFLRKMLSVLLALTMCLSLPLSVLAEEGTVDVETTAGNNEPIDVNITIESAPQADGSVQTNTTTEAEAQVTGSGMIVDYSGQSSMTTDPNGTETGTSSSEYFVTNEDDTYNAVGGSEMVQGTQAPSASVDVPLTSEEGSNENTGYGDEAGTTNTTGDVPQGPNDGEYDYNKETVVEQGSVTATTNEVIFREEADVDMDYITSTSRDDGTNDLFNYDGDMMTDEQIAEASKEASNNGYTHLLIGSDVFSRYSAALISKNRDPSYDADEEPVFIKDGVPYYAQRPHTNLERGKYFVDGFYLDGEYVDEEVLARWDYIQRFVFVDVDTGEIFTTYCVDQQTVYQTGFNYIVQNLEDANYYSEENAAKIRAVALNGYWGAESGAGSLDELKAKLAASGEFTEEELAMVTDGLAMTATQYAIWTYSNEENGDDFISAYYIKQGKDRPSALADGQEKEVDLLFKVCSFLTNLAPVELKGDTSDTMINKDNFLKDLSVKVIEKAENHDNNYDNNTDNDAYVTEITFALKVTPSGKDGEEMVVEIVGENGVLAKGRISGEAQPGEVSLKVDDNGNYTFENIIITEGDQNFSINLSGVQHLEEGVYLYTSEIKDNESSQTMVGLANGTRNYNVTMEIDFKLDVKDEVVATEHVWRTEWTNSTAGNDDPPAPGGNNPEATTFTIADEPVPMAEAAEDGTVEIEDEEVPLADAPKTGDSSLILAAISALSGLGYAGLTFTTRRKEQ